jgi:di/tricarboxylate transporter
MKTSRHEHQLVELAVSRQSPAVGHKVSELPLPGSPFELMLVGVAREGAAPSGPLGAIRVEPGDAAIVEVDNAFFYEARRETDFILTRRLGGFRVQRVDRAVAAGAITACMVAAAALGVMSMLNAALLATCAMLATGCLTVERLWESVDWRIVVTLGAAVGLESAVTGSGLSQTAAHALAAAGGRSPMTALALVYVGTVVMANVMSNAAAVALMFPVARSLATDMGVSFLPFAMALIGAAACAFVNPVVVQTNLMVRAPGDYTFADFARVGLPLTFVVSAVVLTLIPLVYGF